MNQHCVFCSVNMIGSCAYTGKNGETVYADYIRNKDGFCKNHCSFYSNKYE